MVELTVLRIKKVLNTVDDIFLIGLEDVCALTVSTIGTLSSWMITPVDFDGSSASCNGILSFETIDQSPTGSAASANATIFVHLRIIKAINEAMMMLAIQNIKTRTLKRGCVY